MSGRTIPAREPGIDRRPVGAFCASGGAYTCSMLREIEVVREVAEQLARGGQAEEAEALEKVLAVATAALGEPQRRYLTTGQAAEILAVSRQTIVNWVKSGQMPGVRLGGRTLVQRDAVLRDV